MKEEKWLIMQEVLGEVAAERERQDGLWGEQNHIPVEYYTILVEEIGEVARALCEGDVLGYRKELIHSSAVAVAMIEAFDRNTALLNT
jgi:NTP pyrophosphatase (non-canonical NTP hydrolase)